MKTSIEHRPRTSRKKRNSNIQKIEDDARMNGTTTKKKRATKREILNKC